MKKCQMQKDSKGNAVLSSCAPMNNYLNHEKSVFQKVLTVNIDTKIGADKIKCGKQKAYVYLEFCPFCGGALK